jgi:hypothetical protein
MNAGSRLCVAISVLCVIASCHSSSPQPEKPMPVTTVAAVARSEAFNATPTSERGTYRLAFGLERITAVQVSPLHGEDREKRTIDANHWSYDSAKSLLHIDAPVDDSREMVIVLGARHRPPTVKLDPNADVHSIRVVVGDHVGVEGQDYVIDSEEKVLRLLGPDTPEAPLKYFVQYMIRSDPAHPELAQSVAAGNRGDMDTIHKLLGTAPH